ncbi:MAG TPA: hypothetical protein VM695_10115 [Phycisphaerae bacterium]|nr:hypothetical protein [Phycisphaerae bacterium]
MPNDNNASENSRRPTEAEREVLLSAVGVPDLFLKARPDQIDHRRFQEALLAGGGFFYGPTGGGKSHAAAAILYGRILGYGHTRYNPLADAGCPVAAFAFDARWVKVPLWLYDCRQKFKQKHTPDSVRELICPGLLVLDDLGAEKVTDWVDEMLYLVVDGRIEANKPIITTTNLTPQELGERNPRLASRLLTQPRVYFGGEDKRLKGD